MYLISIILDLLIILVFLTFIILGGKNGLVRSLISFLFIFASLIMSIYLSSNLSNSVYNNFIRQGVIEQIELSISSGNVNFGSLSATIPSFIYNSLSYYGITPENINHIINNGKGDISNELERLVSPVFIELICIALSVIFFLIFSLLSGIASRYCSKIFKIPVLKQINTTLGALFGMFKGYIVVTIIVFCIKTVGQVTYKNLSLFLYDNIESTIIFKYMYTNNLICNLLSEI